MCSLATLYKLVQMGVIIDESDLLIFFFHENSGVEDRNPEMSNCATRRNSDVKQRNCTGIKREKLWGGEGRTIRNFCLIAEQEHRNIWQIKQCSVRFLRYDSPSLVFIFWVKLHVLNVFWWILARVYSRVTRNFEQYLPRCSYSSSRDLYTFTNFLHSQIALSVCFTAMSVHLIND